MTRLEALALEMSRDPEVLADIRLTQQLIEDALFWGYEIGEDAAFVLAPYLR